MSKYLELTIIKLIKATINDKKMHTKTRILPERENLKLVEALEIRVPNLGTSTFTSIKCGKLLKWTLHSVRLKCFRESWVQIHSGNTPFLKVGTVLTLCLPHSDPKEQADLVSKQVVMLDIFINIRPIARAEQPKLHLVFPAKISNHGTPVILKNHNEILYMGKN